ncbi:hypothetical protein GCM10009676_29510 [Prauserella halophila]|uniref:Uncharacterized protein n=1 Tax=Prauserella halophila TaxID=185641 RepID=A0ABP4GXW1_9PSEU|nr:hypothetical protein [Prauserella halophila]MCP2237008.1 hypothetical protein [Prauserella halophila]
MRKSAATALLTAVAAAGLAPATAASEPNTAGQTTAAGSVNLEKVTWEESRRSN